VIQGDVYLQNGKQEEAYAAYQRVLEEEPGNPMALLSMAAYYEQAGEEGLYRQQVERVLLNQEVEPEAKVELMRQFIVQNEAEADRDSTEVIRLFDRIIEANSEDTEVPMLYAQYLLAKKMDNESVPVLQHIVQVDPTNKAARLILLSSSIKKNDFKAVIAICEPGIIATPEALEFYFYLAIAYNQAERNDDVIAICKEALRQVNEQSPKEMVSDFYTILGDVYHTQERSAESYAAYDSALIYRPDNVGALNNYAYYLSVERRELDRAEEMSYRTVKAEPKNGTYLDTYAWILFEKGNYAEAMIYIDQAMQNGAGESDVVVEHCGDIYFMNGKKEEALKYWVEALKMGSESTTLKDKIKLKKYVAE
jgi:tetratricopeptide (TPR) repeat protein